MANAPLEIYNFFYTYMCFTPPILTDTTAWANLGFNTAVGMDFDKFKNELPQSYKLIKTLNTSTNTPQNIPLCVTENVLRITYVTVGGITEPYPTGRYMTSSWQMSQPIKFDGDGYLLRLMNNSTPVTASPFTGTHWERVTYGTQTYKKEQVTYTYDLVKKPIIVTDMYTDNIVNNTMTKEYFPKLVLDGFRSLPQPLKNHGVEEISQYFDYHSAWTSQINPRTEMGMLKSVIDYYVYKLKLLDTYLTSKSITHLGCDLVEYLLRTSTEAFFTNRSGAGESSDNFREGIITGSLHYVIRVADDTNAKVNFTPYVPTP